MSEKNVSDPKDGAVQSLKAERVQTELAAPGARLKAERVQLRLKQMPGCVRGGITDKLLDFAARLG